jgi:hypothetical protein
MNMQERPHTQKIAKALALALAMTLLAVVFALYARPDFMVQLANQMWACF